MRRAAILSALALAGCSAAPHGNHDDNGLSVRRAALRPGAIALFVHNGGDRPATLAQVAIDSGFVGFDGAARRVPPHGDAVLTVPYPWVPGEAYTVKVLTGSGETIGYRIAAH